MPVRKKDRPYLDLGNLFEKWRSRKFSSALKLFQETEFSFSYSAYTDFERGVTLPSVPAVVEIAKKLGQEPDLALLLWARVQMPSSRLRALFDKRNTPKEKTAQQQPNFENTWVFAASEKSQLEKSPWLWDLVILLAISFPHEVSLNELMRTGKGIARQELLNAVQPWIGAGHIQQTKSGLQLVKRYVHLPKTEEWETIRLANFKRAVESITVPYRTLLHRGLTAEEARAWTKRLGELEQEFLSTGSYDQDRKERTHSEFKIFALGVIFGERF
ncbi:hypothetical protein K2X30_15890 [bacterium]|jgi:hypothetical protein|nr:hypothetical protein [bacterium]